MSTPVDLYGRNLEKTAKGPFLMVSMQPVVECCKCGNRMPAPGRMSYYDGETLRFWCDCVTEEEMDAVALDFEQRRQLELAILDTEE